MLSSALTPQQLITRCKSAAFPRERWLEARLHDRRLHRPVAQRADAAAAASRDGPFEALLRLGPQALPALSLSAHGPALGRCLGGATGGAAADDGAPRARR